MKAKNNSRKGFTIVELVIVIAVVAVLAAVLIPTFVSLVSKANNSADVQMVTNINKYLAAMEVSDGKNITMGDAVKDAEAAGYKAALLTASNEDNKILWDMKNDRFLVVNGKKIVAGLDEKKIDDKKMANYWVVSPLVDDTYSTYYIGKLDENITLTGDSVLGFDVGDAVVDLTYGRTANDVVLNGVFNSLTVSGTGKPTVHGYVYQLSGNVNADGAVFHDDKRDNVTATANTVTYGVCYDDGNGYCLFCTHEICKHVWNETNRYDATCLGIGLIESACATCHKGKYEVLAPLGHDWQELVRIEPTCTSVGQAEGRVCLRCNMKEEGALLPYKYHDFNDSDVCIHCGLTREEYYNQAIKVTQDAFDNGTIDFGGKDKRKDVITLILNSDLTVDADDFCKVFGTTEVVYWLKDDNTVGGTESIASVLSCNDHGLYAVDIVLNGYSLTINSGDSEFGVETYGHLRITGRPNLDNNEINANALVLNGKTKAYNSMIHTAVGGAAVTFDSINVTANYYPIALIYLTETDEGKTVTPNDITIRNSSLVLKQANYVAETTKSQNVNVYIELTKADNGPDINMGGYYLHNTLSNNYNDGYVCGITGENYYSGDLSGKYAISFFVYNANGDKVELEQKNYFATDVGYSWKIEQDINGYFFTVSSCEIEIKDTKGNNVSVIVKDSLSADWDCWAIGQKYDSTVAAEHEIIDEYSKNNITIQ